MEQNKRPLNPIRSYSRDPAASGQVVRVYLGSGWTFSLPINLGPI